MDDIIIALRYTPDWVYLLFAYLLIIGFRAVKTSKTHILNLTLLPILFIAIFVQSLFSDVGVDTMTLSIGSLGLIVGATIGWMLVWQQKIVVETNSLYLELPGNWHILLAIVIVFTAKFWFGYELARDPNLVTLTVTEVALFFVIALCSGLFVGKFFNFLFRIYHARLRL